MLSYGDKETYWIAMELMKEEYSFNQHYPGAIGILPYSKFMLIYRAPC
jgi:hypothetical protein